MFFSAEYECLKMAWALKRLGMPGLKESGGHSKAKFTICLLRVFKSPHTVRPAFITHECSFALTVI